MSLTMAKAISMIAVAILLALMRGMPFFEFVWREELVDQIQINGLVLILIEYLASINFHCSWGGSLYVPISRAQGAAIYLHTPMRLTTLPFGEACLSLWILSIFDLGSFGLWSLYVSLVPLLLCIVRLLSWLRRSAPLALLPCPALVGICWNSE